MRTSVRSNSRRAAQKVMDAPVSIALDYPPSASCGPRYGHGRPPHPRLLELFRRCDATFERCLRSFLRYADELRRIEVQSADPLEPSWINDFLPGLDGVAIYGFLRKRDPARYFEIGSGNSTRFAARARRDGALKTRIRSIDPHPRAEVDALCDEIVREPLESVDVTVFGELRAGDVLFMDGSHRTFTNSDATVFFLDVIPSLAPGVLVGIHDIYLPYDYPPDWTGRYYSEQYLLAAHLLAEGPLSELVLASTYVSAEQRLASLLEPLWAGPQLQNVERHGGAFWLQIRGRPRRLMRR
jgi:hypothetical protein